MSTLPPCQSSRRQVFAGVLWAATALAACDIVYALAQRWGHPPEYFALCAALALALALAVATLAALLRRPVGEAVALWVAVSALVVSGPATALAIAGIAWLLSRSSFRRGRLPNERDAALAGTCAAGGLLVAIQASDGVADAAARHGAAVPEWVCAAALYLVVGGGLTQLFALVPAHVRKRRLAFGLFAALLVVAAKPVLKTPPGTHRLPPSDWAASAPRGADDARPNVFLLVLDTVRADHMSVYGYERETTPQLARLLRERPGAVLYEHCYANATWTVPSHATLFTGRLPHEHGAHFARDGRALPGFALEEGMPTLAERLRDGAGYATLGAFANNWLLLVDGLGRGFDRYMRAHHDEPLPFVGEHVRSLLFPGVFADVVKTGARAEAVNELLLSLVDPWSEGPNPLFVFANYTDAHGPYAPPADVRGRFAPASLREAPGHVSMLLSPAERQRSAARYDEELLGLDARLGELFDALDSRGLLAESWVFVTSDHGEAFGEHGVSEHGTTVFDEVVRIPLLVFPPHGVVLEPDPRPVSLVDVATTVAAIAGESLGGPGRDLRSRRRGIGTTGIEFYGDPVKARAHGALAARPARAVVAWPWKLIDLGDELRLYDLSRDPGEREDRSRADPELAEELRALLPAFGEPVAGGGAAASDPELLDQLRKLGYLGGS